MNGRFAIAGLISVAACGAATSCGSEQAVRVRADTAAPPVTSTKMTRRVPAAVRNACRDAATRVEITVRCPRLLPARRVVRDRRVTGALVRSASPPLYEITVNSGLELHWISGGGDLATVERIVLEGEGNEVAGEARRGADVRVPPWTFRTYRFGPRSGGPHSGHVAVVWAEGADAAFVTVHGRAHQDVAVAMLQSMLRP